MVKEVLTEKEKEIIKALWTDYVSLPDINKDDDGKKEEKVK